MAQPVQQRSIQTRERLVRVAEAMAAEVGLSGLRTDAIVSKAEVAKGTFFAHFPDRDHLIALLVAMKLKDLMPSPEGGNFMAGLEALFLFMAQDPQVLDMMAKFNGPAGQAAGLDRLICDLIAAQAAQLAQMQAKGLVRPFPDPATLAEGAFAFLLHAAASAQCSLVAPDREARQKSARELLIRLIGGWLTA